MKKVTLEYRRLWHTVKKTVLLPERWEELTAVQFIAAIRLWMGEISENEFLRVASGFKKVVMRRMDEYQRYALVREMMWVRNVRRPHNAFIIDRLPGTDLHAPGTKLKGCTLQQFMTFDSFYCRYLAFSANAKEAILSDITELYTDEAISALNSFIATLYRRDDEYFSVREAQIAVGKTDGVKLVMMNEHLKDVAPLPQAVKEAVSVNYVLIRSWLSKAYPHLFPEGEDEDVSNTPKSPKPVDWLKVFDAFIGDNIADIEKYKAMQATDAFRIMNRRIREAKLRK